MRKFVLIIVVLVASLAVMAPAPPRVTICHVLDTPPTTMDVPLPALDAHLGHGDYLGSCLTPTEVPPTATPVPSATPVPTDAPTPAPQAKPLFKMWLLESWADWEYRHCLIISDTHPSLERQAQLCFPWVGFWNAHNAPCAAYVYDDDTWACDKYTPHRLPLDQLMRVWR
jgi:hypothetical protein